MSLNGENGAGASTPMLKKGFTFRAALAFGFADISPIVALYTVFALGLFTVGPVFFWALPVVLAFQILVAVCFGEMSSKYPYAGSVYQWARHIRGRAAGWFTAWAYIWGLTAALATSAIVAAGFLFELAGWGRSPFAVGVGAVVIVVLGSICNMTGRVVLRVMIMVTIVAEIVGSVGLAIVFLVRYQVNPVSVLGEGLGGITGPEAFWQGGAMLTAIAFVGYSFLGFEAAGSIAEEVRNASRQVPRAIIYSLFGVGATVILSCWALIVAAPNVQQLASEGTDDPLVATLQFHMGGGASRVFLALIVIGFLSSFLAVQAAVSRCIWGVARDEALIGNKWLVRLRGREGLPVNAILATMIVAILLIMASGTELYRVIVNFTSIGFYIAFGIPVWCLAVAVWQRVWVPGPFSSGRWRGVIVTVAAAWVLFETINIAWPRDIMGQPWYIDWSVLIATVSLAIIGLLIYRKVAPYMNRPIGDRLTDEGHQTNGIK